MPVSSNSSNQNDPLIGVIVEGTEEARFVVCSQHLLWAKKLIICIVFSCIWVPLHDCKLNILSSLAGIQSRGYQRNCLL